MKQKNSGRTTIRIISLLIFIILIIISISEHQTKELYKEHISMIINDNLHNMVSVFQENENMYDTVLRSGKITLDQARVLAMNNELIQRTIQENADVAVKLKYKKEGFQYNQSSLNAQKIALLFSEINESSIDSEEKLAIEKIRELNKKWISSSLPENGTDYSLSNSHWIELIDRIEKSTLIYLQENNITNVEEIWIERTQIN